MSGKENVFSLLNCKFVGENKKILLDILYTSLGVYLDYFGLTTVLFSLFLFIGIIFILIVIKNTDLEAKAGVNNQYSETLDNIWKGNDFNPQSFESDIPIYQLVDN